MEFLREEIDLDEITLRRLHFKCIGMNLEYIRTLRPGISEHGVQSQIGDDGWVLGWRVLQILVELYGFS
jgi:hypothetical protein